ncbi:MAG TPA: hypothetical protein VHE78_18605, partial [Gemmatimonadaceae bacterium]|nr:hypothetical protein [Gemmatimonadaceae bacterium]
LIRLGDVSLLHLTNALLGVLALGCIRAILASVFPAPALARELDLVTLACAVHPVLLSTLLQVNIDFGVYVFFFATLAALLRERFAWTALAGVFLCFSKETGVLAYAIMIGLWALFRVAGGSGGTPIARIRRLTPMWVTVAPLVLFGVHVAWWNATHTQAAVWKHAWQRGPLDGFRFFNLSDSIFQSYAAGIFLLGFMWVLSVIIGADLLAAGVRMVRRLPDRDVPGAERRALAFVSVLTALVAYLLTAFRTWSNLRYFALLYPLLVLLAFAALLRLRAGTPLRIAVLAGVVLLFAWASFRSADPVSRAVYGTFSIGEREMYRMASISGEYKGPGRDELVYNLEFTGYHAVQNALYRVLHPADSTSIATAQPARREIFSALDAVTLRRTLRRDAVIMPRYWDEASLLAASVPFRPRQIWFLDFSFRPDADSSLQSLATLYRESAVVRATAEGHTIVAHLLDARVR